MDVEVFFWPSGRSVRVRRGTTILDASRKAGISIKTRCGGKAACFMCKVIVRPESELLPIGDEERRKLAGMEEKIYDCHAKQEFQVKRMLSCYQIRFNLR